MVNHRNRNRITRATSLEITAAYQQAAQVGEIAKARGGFANYQPSGQELLALRESISELRRLKRRHPMRERITPLRQSGIVTLAAYLGHNPEEWSI